MRYISTRGQRPALHFEDAVMMGLAPDGGLYVPESWPQWSPDALRSLRGCSFQEVAVRVLAPFVTPSLSEAELRTLVDRAYASFDHPDIAPVSQLGDVWLLELFHGPTLAFKDVALQLLGQLFDHFLARRGSHATVLGATSGDTGSAAIAGCRGRSNLDIVILHPHGRTSAVQRRQMTTVADANVHNFALEGTFDDCQAIVKQLFNEPETRARHNLCAVNSINTARVLAQMVYYFTVAVRLGAPETQVQFCVPTGNFGDVLAGHWARKMGVPMAPLVIATNSNDILARTLETGAYRVAASGGAAGADAVRPTLSPSMDILVSSNFERLLFELYDNDPAALRARMAALAAGGFELGAAPLARLRAGFVAGRTDDAQTLACIGRTYREHGVLVDPHTAVALDVAARLGPQPHPVVVLATAHPAKFPDAVAEATGVTPPLPGFLADLFDRPERFEVLPAEADAVRAALADTST